MIAGETWRPRRRAAFSTLSEDSQVLATWYLDQKVRLFDVETGLQRGGDVPQPVLSSSIAISPDGSAILSCGAQSTVRLWQTRGSQLQSSAVTNPRTRASSTNQRDFQHAVLSSDGTRAFAGAETEFGQGQVLDVASGSPCGVPIQFPALHWLAISSDGRYVAAASPGYAYKTREGNFVAPPLPSLRVWDAATGKPVTPVLNNLKYVHALSFSPDGKTLVVGAVGGTFLWDIQTAQLRASLFEDNVAFATLFRADGKRLAVASKEWPNSGPGGFRLWDPTTGKPVGTLVPLPGDGSRQVLWMAFAEEGGTLRVFDGLNGKLHSHDAETGAERHPPQSLEPATQVAFSDDGGLLATSQNNGTIYLWNGRHGPAASIRTSRRRLRPLPFISTTRERS